MLKSHYKDIFENQDSHWWYKGMEKINTNLLSKYLFHGKSKLKILDAGCGSGAALKYLSKFGNVIGVDISDEALRFAKKRGKVRKANVSSLPFNDSSFDVVVCLDVLFHQWIINDMKAISEFSRVLKKDGILLMREPAFDWMKSNEDVIGFTRYRYTTDSVKRKLNKSSFDIMKISYANFFLFPLVLLKRLPVVIGLKKESAVSDIYKLNRLLNFFLSLFLFVEAFILKYINLPYGTSVIGVARKKN